MTVGEALVHSLIYPHLSGGKCERKITESQQELAPSKSSSS